MAWNRSGSKRSAGIDTDSGGPVYLAISGRTLEFDGSGSCVGGGCK